MDRQPLGIGVIGAGNIIKHHAQAYRSLPKLARLVAVADIDRKRARQAKERYEFQHAYQNHKELLGREGVHAVSICAPAGLHRELVIDAIEAGKHVLREKPIATSLADADAGVPRLCEPCRSSSERRNVAAAPYRRHLACPWRPSRCDDATNDGMRVPWLHGAAG